MIFRTEAALSDLLEKTEGWMVAALSELWRSRRRD